MLVACLSATNAPGSQEALLVFQCFIAVSLVFATHMLIGAALERLAGE
jgi:hypothetical protein